MVFRRFQIPVVIALLLAGCDQQDGMPEEGKMRFGSLESEQITAFFFEKTSVELPEPPINETTFFKYYNEEGRLVGFTDIILKTSPKSASTILKKAKQTFVKKQKSQGGVQFEYRNYVVGDYAGMTIPEEAPVLYWDDGTVDGEQIRLEIDPEGGVIRLAYSIGVMRDELSTQAAAKRKEEQS